MLDLRTALTFEAFMIWDFGFPRVQNLGVLLYRINHSGFWSLADL